MVVKACACLKCSVHLCVLRRRLISAQFKDFMEGSVLVMQAAFTVYPCVSTKQQHICSFTAAAVTAATAFCTLSSISSSSSSSDSSSGSRDTDDISEGHMYNTCMSCVS